MTPGKFSPQGREKFEERIVSEAQLRQRIGSVEGLGRAVVIDVDLTGNTINWDGVNLSQTTFLGCQCNLEEEIELRRRGAYFYRHPDNLPYNPYRVGVYHWRELMEGYSFEDDQSLDYRIYNHFDSSRHNPPIHEALCQRIHDHAIDDALRQLLDFNDTGMTGRPCVGFMGGHSTPRTDPFYRKTALTARKLTRAGYFVVSGGGPGIMESANLGAYLADHSDADFNHALALLEQAPQYTDRGYHLMAYEVLDRFPKGRDSLAIPTWFYGHEPSNLFGSHIAKYFSNSIREDTLLAICLHGIVFSPGSAGTTQEIFQDATQNHYGTFNYYSPMVFLGRQRYELDTLIYPLLRQLSQGKAYHDLLFIHDEPEEIVRFIEEHPPIYKGENLS